MLDKEVSKMTAMNDHIKTTLLPDNLSMVKQMIAETEEMQKKALDETLEFVSTNIKKFATRVEYFEIEVSSAMTKFKRLISDSEVFQKKVSKA